MLDTRDSVTYIPSFAPGVIVGFVLDGLAGLASTLAAVVILLLIFRRIKKEKNWEALDVSVIALFVSEVLLGIGHAMDLKWAVAGNAGTGVACTAQSVIRQLGGTGSALAALTIAVQTFTTIWRLETPSRRTIVIVTLLEALFLFLCATVPYSVHTRAQHEYFAAPAPYWCWIGKGFLRERIGLEYAWFWVALFGSCLLYIPLFLLHFGVIPEGNKWYQPRLEIHQASFNKIPENLEHKQPSGIPGSTAEALSRGNLKLWSAILYPIVYCVLVLPLSIVRFIGFHEEDISGEAKPRPVATFVVIIIFALSGVFNAVLYRVTRESTLKPIPTSPPVAPPV